MTQRASDAPRDTRDRLIEVIAAHGPITARELAERFDLTSAAVRRHLSALEADGVIVEHEVPVASRGRGRPSKSFVIGSTARIGGEGDGGELGRLALDALDALAGLGGAEAVEAVARARVEPWERAFEERSAELGPDALPLDRVRTLARVIDADGYATTVRPLTVTVPAANGAHRPRTVMTAQLCQGHCPVQDVAAAHPQICEIETRSLSRMLGVPVQRLATLAGGAHACTTHIPLTEGRTP